MPGGRVQFGAAGQDVLQAGPVFLGQGGGGAGVSQPVTCHTVGGRGGASAGTARKVAMCARTML
ncbi:hypothetical protein [Streptomyces sp. NPDC005548]|uniref:hypothetical protein n=1 Tax=Streptomyces sp. NPDC005548 TaxID=3364724 RepID=UPI00368698F1